MPKQPAPKQTAPKTGPEAPALPWVQAAAAGAPGTGTAAMVPTPAPAPSPGLGGIDLAGLASKAQAETDRRIEGQGSMIASYLDQVLGLNDAKNAADSERLQRMLAFRRQQALLNEGLQRDRANQQAALQRARIEHGASEGQLDRDHRAAMAAEERAFELGQAATQSEERELRNQLLELQVRQAEQELGGGTTDGRAWPQFDVSFDRGAALSEGRRNDLRDTTFTESQGGGWGFLNIGAKDVEVGYGERVNEDAREIVDKYGLESDSPNPAVLRQKLLELFNEDPQLASLALYDLGYNPQAFLQGG